MSFSAYTVKENSTRTNRLLHREDVYLGQKPPGLIPKLFAPDIIRTEYREATVAFMSNLKELYYCRRVAEHKSNALVVGTVSSRGYNFQNII